MLALLPSLVNGFDPAMVHAATSNVSLIERLIAGAKDGESVRIPPGTYEGRFTLNRSIRLVGEGTVTIRSDEGESTVAITAKGAALEGIRVVHDAKDKNAAVYVAADEVKLESLEISTKGYGILLRKANRVEIGKSQVRSLDDANASGSNRKTVKRNGIDLFDSHQNIITGNTVSNMNDGIYLESSNGNVVSGNAIDHSRYGVHCMFTKQTVVKDNHGYANVTGAMIMGVNDAVVTGNRFAKQSENVNSQGLLLFDVHTSRVEGNLVEGNRVGLYIEQSTDNLLQNNQVLRNFTGIQLLDAENNRFTNNDFIGNVIEAEATGSKNNQLTGSKNNQLTGNYWDAYRGIDSDGDGASNTAYAINPFFQQLTSETPAYQLFFRSPGMLFLESLFETNRNEWASDAMPLMKPAMTESDGSDAAGTDLGLFTAGACLLLVSSWIILQFGGRRR
ncbi:right-handed parallel beta-helix repeat-containing protein [Paenibacillus sp. MWE-103]|uniref:Right-handed parallel beta-helix repeat-containing protein n=1 Tax=Paenibacillus artemisiicola TaxID=1172618 RepID=A0ABS3W7F7_9BACL|nr:NosD domain-containing protein [Paenibacillus artemisiicola]MBO7744246.1 right-handed parallel beta-helix repeat-containing protein [Paenibacillus artemisiicola]